VVGDKREERGDACEAARDTDKGFGGGPDYRPATKDASACRPFETILR